VIVILDSIGNEVFFDLIKQGVVSIVSMKEGLYEFLDAVKAVLNGGAYFNSQNIRVLVESFWANPVSPLSDRETEVLRLIIIGKSYTQISDDLFIAKDTAKTHIRNIYKKLNVTSKSEVVRLAIEERLVPLP
jgi:DNA-binding NarL/FixJ family response regulator